MSSRLSAQDGEVVNLVRPCESGRDAAEDFHRLLPQCKTRRNYSCSKCTFHTRNSRDYLLHTRDVHFEKFKIYDCPRCVYASRHHQKLLRHMKVHTDISVISSKMDSEFRPPSPDAAESMERIEDFLEEVEECEEDQMDVDDSNEDSLARSVDIDAEGDRPNADEATPSNTSKDKSKFFSCNKCNYVTHIRGRFTKHVKYHSMPMIKCTMCDFRTPYKWNLDRHNKNHGGSGSFHCSMCNFTADIKQSLTVHEMNHHTPPVGQSGVSRRRNRVGASDAALTNASTTLVPKEEEGSGDSRSSHAASVSVAVLARCEGPAGRAW